MAFELGIIGAGNMAEAITRGVIAGKVFAPDQLFASDVVAERRRVFEAMGVKTTDQNDEVARQSRRILLSVKPQQMSEALAGIGQRLADDALVISIAAGITTRFIEQHLGAQKRWRVVRTMPNTPMLVGSGMAAIAAGAYATGDDLKAARMIFESAAKVIEVSEDKLDAVTALSGSGPAYFFYLVEEMIEAGVAMGLTPEHAHQLSIQTAAGSAKMLAESSDPPQELRRKVTSPGGTTQAAIAHLESTRWGQSLIDAIAAAKRRSEELST